MLGASLNLAFDHPNPKSQFAWNTFQIGLLIFPLSPFVGVVAIILASLLTWLQQYRQIIRRPINRGFAILTLLLLITSGFATYKTDAFLGLFNLVPYFLVFAGWGNLIQTVAQLRQIAWILVIGAVPVIVIGFGQLFLAWALKLQFLWIVLDWAVAPGGEPPGRMAALFMHANLLAAYLAIIFTVGIALLLEQWQSRKRKKSLIGLLTLILIASFAALILTNSRNGWAIAMIACLAYALYQGWRILVGSVVGVISTILLAAFAPSPIAQIFRRVVPAFFWARLNDEMYPDRPVALMRKTQWEFAWSLAQQHPWTGWGLRSFSALYKAKMNIDLGHPHNLFLMLSAETGFPATLLFCGLLAGILIAGMQFLRQSNSLVKADRLLFFSYLLVFGELILFNTVDVTLFDFRVNTLFWLFLAAICGVVFYPEQNHKTLAKEN
ncbi:O-antigen ligase family protein [Nostoc spongiaeforme FACHB-130]|uniref:O-antigen ligase family protein n=1 Tax=Nostoc spongiaeforme FACHB-130 TaxID=1357510 RepID=A0ABR8FRB1_9NOSO|nr:O-antigen ligase family protein [Nostoc spongiaeforme]MBD2593777.1 O-antigen ligase family protein [Nostoc spongiaeforme FACHB-130]